MLIESFDNDGYPGLVLTAENRDEFAILERLASEFEELSGQPEYRPDVNTRQLRLPVHVSNKWS